MGMLIQPPIEQTPKLFRDVGLVVFNIMDDIRLLLCKVYNVCLELKPCQVRNHLLGHDNHRAPKRDRNDGQHHVITIPHVTNFASLFDKIEFTQFQDPCLERHTTSPPQELLPMVSRIMVVNGYQCKAMDVHTIKFLRRLSPIIVWPTIFSYQFMPAVNCAKCSAFSKRSGTLRIFMLTTSIWSLWVTERGSNLRSKYMFH